MAFFTYENGTDNCFRLAHLSGVGSEMVKRLKNATETLKCISKVACDSNPESEGAAGKEV